MTLPDLYLVGAAKAGTTSLAGWLAGHPDVFWSTPKEPYYWASDFPRMRAHYGFDTPEAYARLYASAAARDAAVRGDGSTTYLYSTEAVPSILREVPHARFIVCLRNPVDLLVSYHRTQLVALNEDEPDFGAAWRRSLDGVLPGTDPLDPKLVDYPLVGRLGRALSRLLDLVPDDRVHTVVFDEITSQPDKVCASLATFVGIDPRLGPAFTPRNASDKMFRSSRLRRLTHRPPAALQAPARSLRQWSRTTSTPGVAALKRRMWRQELRPSAGAADLAAVAAYFREDVALLESILGRDLGHWAAAHETQSGG